MVGRNRRGPLQISQWTLPKCPLQKPKRMFGNTRVAPTYAASMLSTATQNLINMVVVIGVSGAVLFALLVARHF